MRLSILSLFMLAMLAFSSCQKGGIVKDEIKKDDLMKDDDKVTDKADCFKLVYPITYTMPDGSTVTGNNEEEVWAGIKAWYAAHPDSKAKPVLQYPVQIIWGGQIKTIADEEAMILAKKDCEDETDDLKVCDWDGSKVSDPAVWEEHVVEPLVTSEACGGCIVSGVVKYVKINTDFACVIYYGKGECDEWAYLVTHYGATSDKKEEKCKFMLDCDSGN